MEKNDKKFFKIKELAAILNVSRSLLYEKVNSGDIPHIRIGRAILIPITFVDELAKADP